MFPLLSTIIFLPLIGGIVVLLLPGERFDLMRWFALAFAWVDLLVVLGLALGYWQAVTGFAAAIVGASPTATYLATVHEQFNWIVTPGFSLNYSLDVDGISLLLVALTSLLTVSCIAASFRNDLIPTGNELRPGSLSSQPTNFVQGPEHQTNGLRPTAAQSGLMKGRPAVRLAGRKTAAQSAGRSSSKEQMVKNYMAFMLLLESGMLGVFLASNLFLFYIFWEVMLIPAYFLVGSWGGERRSLETHPVNAAGASGSLDILPTDYVLASPRQDERKTAAQSDRMKGAVKFVLYTSVGSLLMLAGIIALGYYHQRLVPGSSYSLDLATLLNGRLGSTTQMWLFLAFAAAFAVKVPLVPFHSWLPDAYAEAPAPVSAMLAGAMSKTGAYGFLRLCIPLFPNAAHTLAPLINTLAVVGILYCAWMALVQSDIKRLLGYSSISHLGIVILGMFAFNVQGVEGSVLQMVNHGITTGALFLIVGYIETRTGTRHLGDYGGLARRVPVLATVMLIAALSSLGLPGLNSFTGEFLALLGAFQNSAAFGFLGTAVVVPAAWYMMRFFQGMMVGARKVDGPVAALERKNALSDIQFGEFMAITPLLILIFYIGFQPQPLTFLQEPSVVNMLQHFGS